MILFHIIPFNLTAEETGIRLPRWQDGRCYQPGRLHELNSSNKTEVFAATAPLFAVFQDKPNVE
jgi:hypothetical protein